MPTSFQTVLPTRDLTWFVPLLDQSQATLASSLPPGETLGIFYFLIFFFYLLYFDSYSIPIPKGVYDVIIFAAEDEYETTGRNGDVYIEGVRYGTINPYVDSGNKIHSAAKYIYKDISVTDGLLVIYTVNVHPT